MLEENYAKRKHDQSYFLQKAIFINTSKIKFSKIEKNFTFFSLSQQKPLFKTFPSEYYFLNKIIFDQYIFLFYFLENFPLKKVN